MAIAVEVTSREMHEFLSTRGFAEVKMPGTKEIVYSKFVDKSRNICLRVLTSIVGETSRGTGEDAIRTVLVTKVGQDVKIIGCDKRVHRVEGWRANLQKRLDGWAEQLGPACPKCEAATIQRRSRRGLFWGCCRYPVCATVQPIVLPIKNPVAVRECSENLEWARAEAEFATVEREAEAAAFLNGMEMELWACGIYDGDW